MWERELAMAANRHLAAVRKANVHPTMFGGVRIRHSGHPQTFARRVLLNGHRNLLRRLRLSGYHVLPTYSRNEAMEWEKYLVHSIGGKCVYALSTEDDSDDSLMLELQNDKNDREATLPEDVATPASRFESLLSKAVDSVAHDKRHAPVPDDEINVGEPSPIRRRLADIEQRLTVLERQAKEDHLKANDEADAETQSTAESP